MRELCCLLACCLVVWITPSRSARAFSLIFDSGGDVKDEMKQAGRWSAEPFRGTGLHDGIQVTVGSSFAADLDAAYIASLYGVTESEVNQLVKDAVQRAFAVWESPVLRFNIQFLDEGPAVGLQEIALYAGPDSDPSYFAWADPHAEFAEDRLLTNGQRFDGYVIYSADIFFNSTRITEGAEFLFNAGAPLNLLENALQILMAHELGHAIGLGHPNEGTFYDTDSDPYNEMVIDPSDPFADLRVSSIPDDTPADKLPIMWGGISGEVPDDLLRLLPALSTPPSLRFDDIGGRDVLYPSLSATITPTPAPTPTATPTPAATPTPLPPVTGDIPMCKITGKGVERTLLIPPSRVERSLNKGLSVGECESPSNGRLLCKAKRGKRIGVLLPDSKVQRALDKGFTLGACSTPTE